MKGSQVSRDALATHDTRKRLCDDCRQSYKPKTRWQRFCSDTCRSASWEQGHPRVAIGAVKLEGKPTAAQLQAAGIRVRIKERA